MKNLLKISVLFLLVGILFAPACTITTEDDDDDSGFDISDQVAQGFTDAGAPFITVSALAENREWFGDQGYLIHLFADTTICGNINGDVRFFIPSEGALTPGDYDGEGPYITNTSFFGCEVIILDVTDTHIEGKVKGGDPDGDKNIEGKFNAEICM